MSLLARDDTPGMLLAVTRIQTLLGSRSLTSATGFYFGRNGRLCLVTARHMFFDGPSDHAPDQVAVTCHSDARNLTCVQCPVLPL